MGVGTCATTRDRLHLANLPLPRGEREFPIGNTFDESTPFRLRKLENCSVSALRVADLDNAAVMAHLHAGIWIAERALSPGIGNTL